MTIDVDHLFVYAVDYMFISPQNPYDEILILNVTVIGHKAFWRRLGYEGGDHMNGISTLIKETPRDSSAFCHLRL